MNIIELKKRKEYMLTDSEVIRKILSGEKELYEILLRRNNQTLYRVVRSYLNEQVEIEDIMQNTYIKAYEKLHQFQHNSKFSTWLIRIGINEALARLKTKGKYLNLYNYDNQISDSKILELPDTDQINPEKKIIRKEAMLMLENAIDKLDIKYRNVYILREVEGLSINEVSSCLDLTESNVKVRLHRAKSKIKENLYDLSTKNDLFEFGLSKCDKLVDKVMRAIN